MTDSDLQGMFLLADPRSPAGGENLGTVTIYDVAPTILELVGEPAPTGIRGTAIGLDQAGHAYSEKEEALVTEGLRDLGYL